MLIEIASMNQWLYPDAVPQKKESNSVSLKSVRGGSTGFQVQLFDLPENTRLKATFSSTARLGAELFWELPVYAKKNTGIHGFTAPWEIAKDYATREAPFEVYDALLPIPEQGIIAEKTGALYLSFQIPVEASAGVYHGVLRLSAGEDQSEIPVTLTVVSAALPKESLLITNWFNVKKMAKDTGVDVWSEEHWQMIEKYGRAMRRLHQNVFWVTSDLVDRTVDENGNYAFDFTNCERFIRLYLSLGFTKIEGAPIFHRENWDAVVFTITSPKGELLAMSPEGYAYIAAFMKAWGDFFRKNGWYELLIQHVGDEPHERCSAEYRILTGIIRKFLPGIKLIDAVETHEMAGALDIWVPKNDYYSRNMEQLEHLRRLGDEIWFYTCCIPGGHYCNRLLDMPLLRCRMLHWGNYRYQIPGFLHWGLNHWQGDAYHNTCPYNGGDHYLPAGDTNIIYPYEKQVLPSMRGEVEKCGAEDYELLQLLALTDKKKADALCHTLFRAFDDCDNTSAEFEQIHDRLLEAF